MEIDRRKALALLSRFSTSSLRLTGRGDGIRVGKAVGSEFSARRGRRRDERMKSDANGNLPISLPCARDASFRTFAVFAEGRGSRI